MPAANRWRGVGVSVVLAAVIALSTVGFSRSSGDDGVELRLGPELAGATQQKWQRWVARLSESVRSVSGEMAYRPVVVRLEGDDSRRPITFGRVRRGDPPRIDLQVHPDATLPELLDDWRGFHEFAHLMIPFPGNEDIWFTEGLASYYQHLLQARVGVIEPDDAWRRLAEGFQRGHNDSNGAGRSLRELSPAMWRERAFRRVYWTGAAYFLRVDLRLRRESGGRHSLDRVLADFTECCMDSSGRREAEALIEVFGDLSLPRVWREEYTRMIDAPARPDAARALAQLGISLGHERIEIGGDAGQRRLRRAMATGEAKAGD